MKSNAIIQIIKKSSISTAIFLSLEYLVKAYAKQFLKDIKSNHYYHLHNRKKCRNHRIGNKK